MFKFFWRQPDGKSSHSDRARPGHPPQFREGCVMWIRRPARTPRGRRADGTVRRTGQNFSARPPVGRYLGIDFTCDCAMINLYMAAPRATRVFSPGQAAPL